MHASQPFTSECFPSLHHVSEGITSNTRWIGKLKRMVLNSCVVPASRYGLVNLALTEKKQCKNNAGYKYLRLRE